MSSHYPTVQIMHPPLSKWEVEMSIKRTVQQLKLHHQVFRSICLHLKVQSVGH